MREKIKKNPVLNAISKFLKTISWIVLILLLVLAGFLIYYVMMAKKAEKAGVNYKPPMALYTIISPSMVPNINVYDVVFNVGVKDPKTLKVGDVITFVSSDSYLKGMIITHRIVERYEENGEVQFKTKGDANQAPDNALVYEENIIGKVMFKIPQLGRVQFFLSKKSGWLIAILIPALIIISYDILKLIKLLMLRKKLNEEGEGIHYGNNVNSVDNSSNTEQSAEVNTTTQTPTTEQIVQIENTNEPKAETQVPVMEQAVQPEVTSNLETVVETKNEIQTPIVEQEVQSKVIDTPEVLEGPKTEIEAPVMEQAVQPEVVTTPEINTEVKLNVPMESSVDTPKEQTNTAKTLTEEAKNDLLEKLLKSSKK